MTESGGTLCRDQDGINRKTKAWWKNVEKIKQVNKCFKVEWAMN